VAVPPYPVGWKITQAADVLEKLLNHHPDKRHIPDSAASQGKDDGRPPGQTGVVPGGYSGRVAVKREQCNREQQLLLV
jgi:hypothetical protein